MKFYKGSLKGSIRILERLRTSELASERVNRVLGFIRIFDLGL